jgi:hypothetical protein
MSMAVKPFQKLAVADMKQKWSRSDRTGLRKCMIKIMRGISAVVEYFRFQSLPKRKETRYRSNESLFTQTTLVLTLS